MQSRNGRVRGFTLIELLLVMVILVVLAGTVVIKVVGRIDEAHVTSAKTSISNLETALDAFALDCGRFPTVQEGLDALATNPGVEGWKGPYVKLVPADPWGSTFQYRAPGEHFPDSYDLFSLGKDRLEGGDDIVNWKT